MKRLLPIWLILIVVDPSIATAQSGFNPATGPSLRIPIDSVVTLHTTWSEQSRIHPAEHVSLVASPAANIMVSPSSFDVYENQQQTIAITITIESDTPLAEPPPQCIEAREDSFTVAEYCFAFIVFNPSGIVSAANNSAAANLRIFPDPADHEANISLTDGALEMVTIYNIMGDAVMQVPPNGEDYLSLNTSALPSGFYYLEAASNGRVYRERLIVSH